MRISDWSSDVCSSDLVLRKQRANYEAREGRAAQDGDRVTLDFAGTIDGVPFEGGKAENFPFVLGQGRMLPEFEAAASGLKAGETKVFPLKLPDDYPSKEVDGTHAELPTTVTKNGRKVGGKREGQ